MRLSISAIIQPLIDTHVRPQEHFRRFKHAAEAEYSRLDYFRATYQSEPIRELLEYILLSGKQEPKIPNDAALPKYAGVQELHKSAGDDSKQDEVDGDLNGTVGHEAEDVAAVVEAFKQRHPECHVDSDLQGQSLQVSVTTPLGPIVFAVKKAQKPQNGELRWDVECLGTMKLFPAITRCLASRPQVDSLSATLVNHPFPCFCICGLIV